MFLFFSSRDEPEKLDTRNLSYRLGVIFYDVSRQTVKCTFGKPVGNDANDARMLLLVALMPEGH